MLETWILGTASFMATSLAGIVEGHDACLDDASNQYHITVPSTQMSSFRSTIAIITNNSSFAATRDYGRTELMHIVLPPPPPLITDNRSSAASGLEFLRLMHNYVHA